MALFAEEKTNTNLKYMGKRKGEKKFLLFRVVKWKHARNKQNFKGPSNLSTLPAKTSAESTSAAGVTEECVAKHEYSVGRARSKEGKPDHQHS